MHKILTLYPLCFFVIMMAYSSCQSKKVIVEAINIKDQALQQLDPPISLIYNSDSTYVLSLGAGSSKSNPLSKSYCVFDNVGNLISEKKTIHGNVGWYTKETLVLEKVPRVINKRGTQEPVISYFKINEANAKSK